MDGRFKVVIYNKNIYKEIELTSDKSEVSIGTSIESDIRLYKEYFFGTVEIRLRKSNAIWSMTCSDGVYFSLGDARKLLTLNLHHGDEVSVKYNESDNEVFHLSFMIDFDYENKDYSCEISLAGIARLKISNTQDADIKITDNYFTTGALLLLAEENGGWIVKDEGTAYGVYVNGIKIENEKKIKNYDFFSVVGYSFYYKSGILYASKSVNVVNNILKHRLNIESKTHLLYPKFNRNTRIQYAIPQEEIEIQQPVSKPPKPKKNIIITLIPSLVMLAMTIVLRGIIGDGGTFVIYSAVSMSLGVIMSIVTYIQDGKSYKVECAERIKSYNEYVDRKSEEIESVRANELRVRRLIYESLDESVGEVLGFGRRLFERTKNDKDFYRFTWELAE